MESAIHHMNLKSPLSYNYIIYQMLTAQRVLLNYGRTLGVVLDN